MKKVLIAVVMLLCTLSYAQETGTSERKNLKATATAHQVNLSWVANPNPSTCAGTLGYNVYRGNTAGGETAIPLNSNFLILSTTYLDVGVASLQAYFYVVKTSCSTAFPILSVASNEVTSTVPGDPQPLPPVMNPATSQ